MKHLGYSLSQQLYRLCTFFFNLRPYNKIDFKVLQRKIYPATSIPNPNSNPAGRSKPHDNNLNYCSLFIKFCIKSYKNIGFLLLVCKFSAHVNYFKNKKTA